MYKSIPLLKTDEIINKAFSRSSKIVLKRRGPRRLLIKNREMEMVSRSAEIIISSLQKILQRHPDIKKLDDFTKEMIYVVTDVEELNEELNEIRRTIFSIIKVKNNTLKKMEKVKEKEKYVKYRKDAYGKYSSLLRNLDKISKSLNDKRENLKEIPPISSDDYTVVIAGYPNVGKSTILSKLTTSKPKIAPYPFTTTGINIGNFDFKYQRIFVIDTPGILDRPLTKRNQIELKAISAIGFLANILIFVIDVSSSKKYSLEEQMSLYGDLENKFSLPTLLIQNKIDDSPPLEEADLRISAKDGIGIEELKLSLNKVILEDGEFARIRQLEIDDDPDQ